MLTYLCISIFMYMNGLKLNFFYFYKLLLNCIVKYTEVKQGEGGYGHYANTK